MPRVGISRFKRVMKIGAVQRNPLVCTTDAPRSRSGTMHQSIKVATEGVTARQPLLPIFLALALDAIAAGMLLPILPFYIQALGARPIEVAAITSATCASQAFGCLIMGRVSDILGTKLAVIFSLAVISTAYLSLSFSKSLCGVLFSRVLAGSTGGLLAIVQACVVDISGGGAGLPKLLGQIQAAYGTGFALGPIIGLALSSLSGQARLRVCTVFPVVALSVVAIAFQDGDIKKMKMLSAKSYKTTSKEENKPLRKFIPVITLYLAGFVQMLAFSTDSLYPQILKESFNLGENALAALFTTCGIAVILMQSLLIDALDKSIGAKNVMLLGNGVFSIGLLGIAFVRWRKYVAVHFVFFVAHVVGFSMADTATVTLLSRSSADISGGRLLSSLQVVQSVARIFGPITSAYLSTLCEKRLSIGEVGSGAYAFNAILPTIASAAVYLGTIA